MWKPRSLRRSAAACVVAGLLVAACSSDPANSAAGDTCADGVLDGDETGIDCGGSCAPCANVPPPETATDGVRNGKETDVDCGGGEAPKCADGKRCLVDGDCTSDVCEDEVCQAPTPTDGKKNGNETDVDCGGDAAPPCAVGKACVVGADCTSGGCNYKKVCALGRSCTRHFGGDTCGTGGEGGVGEAAWEDCCVTAPVTPVAGPTEGVSVELGKYQVTAGRMRAFLEEIDYDVRGFVQSAREAGKVPAIPGNDEGKLVLDPAWDAFLPTSFEGNTAPSEIADCAQGSTTTSTGTTCQAGTNQPGIYTAVKRHLGGFIFKGNNQTSTGCFVGAPGTHAFRFPDDDQDGPDPQLDQDAYNTKSMQCIDYLVAQAFCVWDGGRLELLDEWKAAFGEGDFPWNPPITKTPVTPTTNSYWGCRFPWATDDRQDDCGTKWNAATSSVELAAYNYSYEYPKLDGTKNDYIVFISAPGRTLGRGPHGHADVVGNNFEITSTVVFDESPHDALHRWSGNGSWEGHARNKNGGGNTGLLNKYGKLGLRCAYPSPL